MNAIARDGTILCCDAGGVPFDEALARVLALAAGPLPPETVALAAAPGRTLATDIRAWLDMPRFDASAMDGYAVRTGDLMPGARLAIVGRTAAGEPPGTLAFGGAHRILTGAPLPAGADAVIAQENVACDGATIGIAAAPLPGANIRRRGEDIAGGQALIAAGTRLDWRHVAVLAGQGFPAVPVRRRPRVALLSTGRELREAGGRLSPGEIHDSNLPMLAALFAGWDAEVRTRPAVADDAAAISAALAEMAANVDLIVTTAGISVGDEDHVRDALSGLGGNLAVVKVAMKPGKPLAAGWLGDCRFIGLPGNPLAALAGAVAFVRPVLGRLSGSAMAEPLRARASFAMAHRPGRTEFVPVRVGQHEACVWVDRIGPDGSGRLSPLLRASGFACVPEWHGDVRWGEMLDVATFANVTDNSDG
ncbi:MAG: molybdopterin molybdotransferase MoeA [Proteobacteria bacterium]|nr:molybdopterin molybdotransferase MoeA [Pseudomonadota bacterium]